MKSSVLYKVIGSNIKRQRKLRCMSQDNLARSINIGRTSIVNIEGGNQRFKICTLYKIAIVLDICPSKLLP